MTANFKAIFCSKLERQHAVQQQHIFQAPSHDGHKRGRDGDDGVVRAKKKQQLQRKHKLLGGCYQRASKDNNEDTTRLYDPSCPLFCLRLRANANNKDDIDKPHKNQNQNQNKKNRHWSDKNVDDMTDRDWHIFMEDFKISYKCKARSRIPRPQPLWSWAESMLCTQLLRAVENAGYKTPSPSRWPPFLWDCSSAVLLEL
ncbi:hypothetical protein MRB53_009587 [Persea americana]|uniref:Uncharacterized protein n=1 Tax=Persea americana TaxID=3435 RepID=A0ACC2LPN2_PERAE|nr:hypothetical protein MRB53_009587 [Persea americana]